MKLFFFLFSPKIYFIPVKQRSWHILLSSFEFTPTVLKIHQNEGKKMHQKEMQLLYPI